MATKDAKIATLEANIAQLQEYVKGMDTLQTGLETRRHGHASAVMPNFTVICEGEKGWLQCAQYEIIKVQKVFWGREDHTTCPKVPAGLTTDRLCEAVSTPYNII